VLALDDAARGVVELGQAHRLRQPPGGVHGEDHGAPAAFGGAQAERGGGGGLAHAAGAAADDDAGALVVQDRVDVEGGGLSHAAPWLRMLSASSYRPARSMPSASSGSS